VNLQRLQPQIAVLIDMQTPRPSFERTSSITSSKGVAIATSLRFAKNSCLFLVVALVFFASSSPAQQAQPTPHKLELSRPIRSWEFLPVTGTRAALFGNELGQMEAWIYPLKLLRDFRLVFHEGDHAIPAEVLARTITVRPESATIVYSSDTFTVRETFFVPVKEQGAVISFDIQTEQPLEIEARFVRDFQLEWPAAIGGTFIEWDKNLHAFALSEETRKFVGLVGSPSAAEPGMEFDTNYFDSQANTIRLGVTNKGRDQKLIVISGSMNGHAEAEATYRHLLEDHEELQQESAKYYEDYLRDTVSVSLPDAQLQNAYDWSRVSVLQGMVTNPYLGTGLVAGYRTSGESARPGFAWFFGRDSMWTSFALNSVGDFADTRTAIDFVSNFQRDDGKIPHEISQTASLVDWFKKFQYGYASADATPLYIIAMNDYVAQSGDIDFAKQKWDSLWKAYQFLKSTYDAQGFPQNFGVGHGWVEGGPLLPVKTELYQTGLGAVALSALANLADATGHGDVSGTLRQEFEQHRPLIEKAFWLPDKKRYAFALDREGKPVDELSVLATVPMWFGLLDEHNADATITQLADSDHQSDWGMRIISDRASRFSGGGYHFGSVWPLFTGWASVGEYRYHRALPAYENLRANALLALDGSLGHVTEVLSGDVYQPLSTSSPHQIWSAAMVVSPILRGMFGLSTDAKTNTVTFSPHVPANWNSFSVRNIRVGDSRLNLTYTAKPGAITLETECVGSAPCNILFKPAISLRAHVASVTSGPNAGRRAIPFHVTATDEDQHVEIQTKGSSKSVITILLRDNIGVAYDSTLPPLGSTSQGLRILSQTWSAAHDTLTLDVAGKAGCDYELGIFDNGKSLMLGQDALASVEGGDRVASTQSQDRGQEKGEERIKIAFPAENSGDYAHRKIVLRFASGRK
jgi:glycogen debranching enzyme